MSRRLRDLVYETALPPGQRIVLGALVWHVNATRYAARGDTIVWPGLDELQERSRLGKAAVKRNLRALRAAGLIEVVAVATPNDSTHYRVVVDQLEKCARLARQDVAVRAEHRRTKHRRAEQQRRAAQRGLVSNPREQPVTGDRNEPPVIVREEEPGARLEESGVRFDGAGDPIRLSRGFVTTPEPRKEPGNEPEKERSALASLERAGPRTYVLGARPPAIVSTSSVCACGHDVVLQHRGRRDGRFLRGERPEGECVVNNCGCKKAASAVKQPPELITADTPVTDLSKDVSAWFAATVAYSINTGMKPVDAWRIGVVDVLDQFAEIREGARA